VSRLYALFTAGVAAWALTTGLHQVLFAWLVVGVLREPPEWIGTAQMCQMLPSFLFLLVGGLTADRLDRRRLLVALHAAAAGAALALAVLTAAGHLGLGVRVTYALVWGTIWTFALPARDALLSEVAGTNLPSGWRPTCATTRSRPSRSPSRRGPSTRARSRRRWRGTWAPTSTASPPRAGEVLHERYRL
jgi:MFS family permease